MMKTIYHLIQGAALAASLVALPAMAVTPDLPVLTVSAASSPVSVEWAHARSVSGGIVVSGFVKRPQMQFGPVAGGLEVSARRADGSLVAVQTVRWNTIARHGGRGASFSARLPVQENAGVEAVQLRYVKAITPAS